jgi:Tol biopolymer transport system component
MNLNSTKKEEILSTEKSLGPPAYSNDGRFITWNEGSYKDKVMAVHIMDLETHQRKILTPDSLFCTDPEFSPDGNQVACSCSKKGGNLDIYIFNLDGEIHYFDERMESIDFSPHWRSNGEQLIFTSINNGANDILLMDLNSKETENITNGPKDEFSACFSPDGKHVLYSSRNQHPENGKEPITKHNSSELYILELKTRSVKQITFNKDLDVLPQWSPKGDRIVFGSCKTGNREVYLMNINGSGLKQLTFTE